MRIDIRFEIVTNFVSPAKTQQSNAAYVKSVSAKNRAMISMLVSYAV